MLHKNGYALGASLDNAVVIGPDSVLNSGGLRFSDEFVRHKVLDIIGDLYLLGAPLKAKVKAVKSGHEMHHEILRTLLERPWAWRFNKNGHKDALFPGWRMPTEAAGLGIVPAL
jgi:UDP-3-O-[3-hydroxymyristoyl] N-acetylglucosamine deacetylase